MTRWATETSPGHSQRYVERMRRLAADGADLAGEARFLDALVPRGARVLDGGCGTGRVGAALAERGHTVVGVDADPVLIEAAVQDHPACRWVVADLCRLDAAELGGPFDAAILAGNVLPFAAPGSQAVLLGGVAAAMKQDAVIAVGFGADRGYSVAEFDADLAAAGLRAEHRFASWDLRPWRSDSDWSVTVIRVK
jgi:SAM-dependent methyltransferase